MGSAIGQILPYAIAIDISCLAIIAVILMLITPKERSNGLAFLGGWLLGLLLLFAAWRQLRKRPKPGEEAPMPKWMKSLDGFTPGRSLALGAFMSGVNPKNLILCATAALTIAQAGLGGAQQAVVLLVIIVVGSIAVAAPVVVYFAMGERSAHVLGEWKERLETNNATVTFVVFLIFGVVLIGEGIGGL